MWKPFDITSLLLGIILRQKSDEWKEVYLGMFRAAVFIVIKD